MDVCIGPDNRECMRCKQTGHVAKDCPHKGFRFTRSYIPGTKQERDGSNLIHGIEPQKSETAGASGAANVWDTPGAGAGASGTASTWDAPGTGAGASGAANGGDTHGVDENGVALIHLPRLEGPEDNEDPADHEHSSNSGDTKSQGSYHEVHRLGDASW